MPIPLQRHELGANQNGVADDAVIQICVLKAYERS
jgi:hypothetical protein